MTNPFFWGISLPLTSPRRSLDTERCLRLSPAGEKELSIEPDKRNS